MEVMRTRLWRWGGDEIATHMARAASLMHMPPLVSFLKDPGTDSVEEAEILLKCLVVA